jgi:hypothetical protein
VILTVRIALFLTLLINFEERNPKITPNIIAPSVNSRNNCTIYSGGGLFPLTSSKLIVNNTIQVPSLNRLYPSINELNLRGAPAYFNSAKTATVSVQDRTDPNINAYDQL